ncbi:TRAP transporter small permease [Desulfovibrio sp. OttesenSCG-928-I05]|nr:TRAP transporter small permease [Desulfovibrio sp. OttesenSCG-928-I05]
MWKKIDKALFLIEGYLPGLLLLGSTLLLFVNIVLRYGFQASTTWAEEVIRYAIVWVTFIGCSLCAQRGSHVGIDLFAQALPEKGKRAILAAGQFASAVFMGFCAYYGYEIFSMVLTMKQKSPAMMMPMAIVYISMPIGFSLSSFRFAQAGVRILLKPGDAAEDSIPKSADEIDLSRLN